MEYLVVAGKCQPRCGFTLTLLAPAFHPTPEVALTDCRVLRRGLVQQREPVVVQHSVVYLVGDGSQSLGCRLNLRRSQGAALQENKKNGRHYLQRPREPGHPLESEKPGQYLPTILTFHHRPKMGAEREGQDGVSRWDRTDLLQEAD
jgi:hypothetical protein